MSRSAGLDRRVAAAAGEVLAEQQAVTPVDVCVGIGWLSGSHVEAWRQGRVARHTALRGSGRVGRSAAGRALDSEALTLAVAASIRHQDTGYDDLLMSGVPRDEARDQIRPAIDRILAS